LPSLIFACLISPLFLFWSYLVSYDLRTAFIFYPWLAFLAGVSIYSIRKTGKIGIFLVFFVLFLIIAENNVKLPQIQYWTKSISLFLLLFLIINALTYLIETHSRYILTFYNSQKMRYSLVILLVVTLLVLPSVFSHKNILDANNDLRISCNDQGFNRKIYEIFQNEPKSILVSEWVTLKNLPGSVDHFWGAQPKDAPEIWISKPAVKYYLHWSNHPLSLAPEIVRQMASSSGLKYEEEKLHPNFILFKKI
jgi:hypothetical protein